MVFGLCALWSMEVDQPIRCRHARVMIWEWLPRRWIFRDVDIAQLRGFDDHWRLKGIKIRLQDGIEFHLSLLHDALARFREEGLDDRLTNHLKRLLPGRGRTIARVNHGWFWGHALGQIER